MSQWSDPATQTFMLNEYPGNTDDNPEEFVSIKKQKELKNKKNNRCLIITISVFLFIIFAGAVVILILLFLLVGERPPTVKLPCGDVEGDFDSVTKSFVFKGIRYAVPPVGRLRFKPSTPLHCNETLMAEQVFRTVDDPPQCLQKDITTGTVKGSEDCLYLNIFSPAISPLHLAPVMVYIHGGYLQFGNATTPGYCPDGKTAITMGIVFVNIQYRLNAFGFLVTESDGGSGNYGFHDQILALKWVQKNIEKFGGDPNQVTIFGHSSGGTSVFALMTSPKAKGLFHRAWILSGSPILNTTLRDARIQNNFILDKVNCSSLLCLQSLKGEDLVNALYPEWDVLKNSVDLPTKGIFEPALAVIDGNILECSPFEAWENQDLQLISDVPLVVGTTAQEVDFGPAPGLDIKVWDRKNLQNYVSSHLNDFDPTFSNITLSSLYATSKDVEYTFTTMTSDVRVNCGNNLLALKASDALRSPVYRYVVTYFPSQEAHPLNFRFPAKYAFHSLDIYGFLNTLNMIMESTSPQDHAFSNVFSENMQHFAKTGYPLDVNWKPYPERIALIDTHILSNNSDYNKDKCSFWNDNNFFSYSWIN